MTKQVLTLGVYGTTESTFFAALQEAQVDLFIDLRMRRGLRGSQYAYANSSRLQSRLRELGIAYLHFPQLAPPQEVRDAQHAADARLGIAKRQRQGLSDVFREGYREKVAETFDWEGFERELQGFSLPALFCVERLPEACHRSLVADELRRRGWEVRNWVPTA
jgi:uncharacterized protein (DUF488 family)